MKIIARTLLTMILLVFWGISALAPAQQASEVDQLVSNGWENYRNALYKEAELDFNRALRMEADNVDAAEGLGAAAYQLQNWPNAKRGYEAAHRLAPENCSYSKSLAYVYMVMKLYDRAENQYTKVAGMPGKPGCDPADNSAKTNLGYLYYRSKNEADQTKAIQVLNQVINSGDTDEATLTRAHYYLGMLYKKKKNYDLSIQNLEKTFEYSQDRTEGRDTLGQLLFNKKEYEKALENLLIAVGSNENSYNINFMIGISYMELGTQHNDEAISYLAKSANLCRLMDKTPRHLPHRHLADLYNKTGEPSKAISISEEGLDLTKDSSERAGLTCTKAKALGNKGRHEDAINLLENALDDPTWGSYASREMNRQEELIRRKEAQGDN